METTELIYLNEQNIKEIGINWHELIDTIAVSVKALAENDFAQPIKPYLRYRNLVNRIIAMPAFLGGEVNRAGIKWIASFPDNINNGINRANSVTILNDADTGIPVSVINTTIVSGLRTAAVTGVVLREYMRHRNHGKALKIGITGFGPIGQLHLDMVMSLLNGQVDTIHIFDLRPIAEDLLPAQYRDRIILANNWEEAYRDADVFMTCTVSKAPYINIPPKKGSIQLNVSLRDYQHQLRPHFDMMVVDDWDEICREKTDVEMMHLHENLQAEDTFNIAEFLTENRIKGLAEDQVLMFNPMGMAIFDIAIGSYYYQKAKQQAIGTRLTS